MQVILALKRTKPTMEMKQIILQLDEERYKLLVEALTSVTNRDLSFYSEKERVIAEQLRGLVITQWTGSREVEPNIYPVSDTGWQEGSETTAKAIGAGAISQQQLEADKKLTRKKREANKKLSELPIHPFVSTPTYPNKCSSCGRHKKHKIHNVT